jgi:hemoglobin-like flavoprotein
MRAEEIQWVRDSFQPVERQAHIAALIFYRRLFALDPSLRRLFQADIEAQAQKLMAMLGQAVDLLEQPARLNSILKELGRRHAGYGVQTAHYEIVGEALLGMLDDVLGDRCTPEVRAAWTKLYGLMATAMQRGAAGGNGEVATSNPHLATVSAGS